MIDLNIEYTTRDGLQVKFYGVLNNKTVIGAIWHNSQWINCTWDLQGNYLLNSAFDIIEKPAKQLFTKDQLVWVWDNYGECKIPRHYSHFDLDENYHFVFTGGCSSVTSNKDTSRYNYCEPYQPLSKPLEEGELVVVWDDFNHDKGNFDSFNIRHYVSKTSDGEDSITSTRFNSLANTTIWNNCVRLSEFTL